MKGGPIERTGATMVTLDGEPYLSFQGCDYLGLAHHPDVRAAAEGALDQGLSVGASRETTGARPVHERLEEALAEWIGTEAALLTTSGTLANLAALEGLTEDGEERRAILDADSHPSLWLAARSVNAGTIDFGAGDLNRAHALMDRSRDLRELVLTDGVFPLTGRIAAAADLARLLPEHGHLVIDDSHALGVLAGRGGGSLRHWDLTDSRVVVTASLAKAVGVSGGVVAGSASVIARIRASSDAHRGSTPPAAPLAAAALQAVDVASTDGRRRERMRANSIALHRMGERLGLTEVEYPLPVLAIPVADEADGKRLHQVLLDAGIYVPHVHYPGAPEAGLLRAAVHAEHGAADLRRLEHALAPHYPAAGEEG